MWVIRYGVQKRRIPAVVRIVRQKVSGTFCEELALRVLRTKGTRHLFIAHCLMTDAKLLGNRRIGTDQVFSRQVAGVLDTTRLQQTSDPFKQGI